MAEEVPEWAAALPDELKASPSILKFQDPAALAKSYVELEKTLGNSIRPPGPDAPPEARTEFFTKLKEKVPELVNSKDENALLGALGAPAKPEEYSPPTELGELPSELVKGWQEQAAELKLTKKQAAAALKKQFELYANQNTLVEKARTELKTEWGAALEERTRLAAAAAEKMGFPSSALEVIKSGRGSAAEMRAFYNTAKALGLDRPGNNISASGSNTGTPALTPLEIRTRMAEIQKNPAYFKASVDTVLHSHLKQEMLKLAGMLPED